MQRVKIIVGYVDLPAGWQDMNYQPCVCVYAPGELPPGCKRIRVEFALPCFGGSADSCQTVAAVYSEVAP